MHVFPEIGAHTLLDLKQRHIRELVRRLRAKKSARKKPLAPKTIHNIYGVVHRVLEDAVADELIDVNPCVLKRGDLPAKVDSDPMWRDTAIFTRDEVEEISNAVEGAVAQVLELGARVEIVREHEAFDQVGIGALLRY